jgi:HSP20 family protein
VHPSEPFASIVGSFHHKLKLFDIDFPIDCSFCFLARLMLFFGDRELLNKSAQEVQEMGFLEKWSPSTDLERLRHEFDDLLERFGFDRGEFKTWPTGSNRPAIESSVDGDKFVVRVDLPGVDPKNIDVKVVNGILTVKGTREEKRESDKASVFRREIRYGSFERAISLPEGIKAENLKAIHHDGVLELSAPMPKEAVPASVKIQVEEKKPESARKAA